MQTLQNVVRNIAVAAAMLIGTGVGATPPTEEGSNRAVSEAVISEALATLSSQVPLAPEISLSPGAAFRDAYGVNHVEVRMRAFGKEVHNASFIVHLDDEAESAQPITRPSMDLSAITLSAQKTTLDISKAKRSAKAFTKDSEKGTLRKLREKLMLAPAQAQGVVASQVQEFLYETPSFEQRFVWDGALEKAVPAGQRTVRGKVSKSTPQTKAAATNTAVTQYSGTRPIRTTTTPDGFSLQSPDDEFWVVSNDGDQARHYFDDDGIWGNGEDYFCQDPPACITTRLLFNHLTSERGKTAAADVYEAMQLVSDMLRNVWYWRIDFPEDGIESFAGFVHDLRDITHEDSPAYARRVGNQYQLVFTEPTSERLMYTMFDVVAHEFAHGYVESHPFAHRMFYHPEGFAVAEWAADTMAVIATYYRNRSNAYSVPNTPPSDLAFNEAVWTIADNPENLPMRHLYDPALHGGLPHWQSNILDLGLAPHEMSGPLSLAFYRLVNGYAPLGPPSGLPGSFSGIGMTKAADLFIFSFDRMNETTGFHGVLQAMLGAAQSRFGRTTEYHAIMKAFASVNIRPSMTADLSVIDQSLGAYTRSEVTLGQRDLTVWQTLSIDVQTVNQDGSNPQPAGPAARYRLFLDRATGGSAAQQLNSGRVVWNFDDINVDNTSRTGRYLRVKVTITDLYGNQGEQVSAPIAVQHGLPDFAYQFNHWLSGPYAWHSWALQPAPSTPEYLGKALFYADCHNVQHTIVAAPWQFSYGRQGGAPLSCNMTIRAYGKWNTTAEYREVVHSYTSDTTAPQIDEFNAMHDPSVADKYRRLRFVLRFRDQTANMTFARLRVIDAAGVTTQLGTFNESFFRTEGQDSSGRTKWVTKYNDFTVTEPNAIAEGLARFEVDVVDASGNVATRSEMEWVDRTPPQGSTYLQETTIDGNVYVRFGASNLSDNQRVSKICHRWDSWDDSALWCENRASGFTQWEGQLVQKQSFSPGHHTLTLTFFDPHGNTLTRELELWVEGPPETYTQQYEDESNDWVWDGNDVWEDTDLFEGEIGTNDFDWLLFPEWDGGAWDITITNYSDGICSSFDVYMGYAYPARNWYHVMAIQDTVPGYGEIALDTSRWIDYAEPGAIPAMLISNECGWTQDETVYGIWIDRN